MLDGRLRHERSSLGSRSDAEGARFRAERRARAEDLHYAAGLGFPQRKTAPADIEKGRPSLETIQRAVAGQQVMLIASVLLLIDTFFDLAVAMADPCGSIADGVRERVARLRGVILGLLTVVLVAWLVAQAGRVDDRAAGLRRDARRRAGGIILLFALIKVLVDDEFSARRGLRSGSSSQRSSRSGHGCTCRRPAVSTRSGARRRA